jgi:hypothetical protein
MINVTSIRAVDCKYLNDSDNFKLITVSLYSDRYEKIIAESDSRICEYCVNGSTLIHFIVPPNAEYSINTFARISQWTEDDEIPEVHTFRPLKNYYDAGIVFIR